jgi:hypothetical protein
MGPCFGRCRLKGIPNRQAPFFMDPLRAVLSSPLILLLSMETPCLASVVPFPSSALHACLCLASEFWALLA